MRARFVLGLMLAAGGSLGLAPAVFAQDSVSSAPGLPGDALDAYRAGAAGVSEQINDYVVDLAPITSSWGGRYAIGPAVKASRSNAGGYFDHLIGAQAVSHHFRAGGFNRPAYALWNAPGQGISATDNTAPGSTLSAEALAGQVFGAAFMEFGSGSDGTFGTGDDENNVVAALIGFQRRSPSRLLVSRITALTNKAVTPSNGTASLGLGGVDEEGNVHLLADSYAMTDPQRLSQRSLVRVRAAHRNPAVVNRLLEGGSGDPGATSVVRTSSTSMTVPGIISAGVADRPVVIATDFAANYVYENAANATATTKAYLPGAAGSPRGSLSFVAQPFTPVRTGGADAGTAATLVRTDANTRTRGVQLFGVNTDGSVDGQLQIELPLIAAQLVDPTDGFAPGNALGAVGTHEFTNYASQASFRGGSGQVAMTVLPGGELLAAATVGVGSGSGVPQGLSSYIAVARVPAAGGPVAWSVAAHTGDAAGSLMGTSKAILGDNGADGRPGTGDAGEGDGVVDTGTDAFIGRLARASEVFADTTTGPSISSPAMDRRGNLYFTAAVALKAADGGADYTVALLRANRDASVGPAPGYRLELLARLGDVVPGLNSGRNYQVQHLGLADADSAASGGIWAGSTVQDSLAGVDAATVPYGSPASLGALVFRAKIVYDVNGDGAFADPSGGGGGSNSPDQAYNALMVLMPRVARGDFDADGTRSVADIFAFLSAWFASSAAGDWNGDGTVGVTDIFEFLADWFAG